MTNEEAISLLEDQMNFNRTMQRGWGNTMIETDAGNIVDGALYANQHKDVADALELAINALRAGGKDKGVPTMPAGQPLTLEQLLNLGERAENGGKIIVYCTPLKEWCKVFKYGIMFFGTEDYRSWREIEETYGKDWLAYAYPPAHIDREAWEPCKVCKEQKDPCYENGCFKENAPKCEYRCDKYLEWRLNLRRLRLAKFCPECGRPLTKKAWAELEKRVMET